MLPFTKEQLEEAIAQKRVLRRWHPTLPYQILNYSPEIQWLNGWDDVTMTCRGLILDDNFNVIARPWQKFFNLGQVELPIQFDTPVEVMDKVDGSLGILYPLKSPYYSGHHDYGIATRGSFESEQAIHASELWTNRYDGLHPMPGLTMLFEIVYPKNRIVLDYGDRDDLVLLGAVTNNDGYYYSPLLARQCWNYYEEGRLMSTTWPGPVVDVMPYKTLSEALGHTDRPNSEGFVVRAHNFMVKIKQPDYLEVHRLVTNATPKTVWRQLRDGKSVDEIVSVFPDEFHGYVESMLKPLTNAYYQRIDEIYAGSSKSLTEYDKRCGEVPFNRGAYARIIKDNPDKRYYFLLLDDKSIREPLWNELEPKSDSLSSIG